MRSHLPLVNGFQQNPNLLESLEYNTKQWHLVKSRILKLTLHFWNLPSVLMKIIWTLYSNPLRRKLTLVTYLAETIWPNLSHKNHSLVTPELMRQQQMCMKWSISDQEMWMVTSWKHMRQVLVSTQHLTSLTTKNKWSNGRLSLKLKSKPTKK